MEYTRRGLEEGPWPPHTRPCPPLQPVPNSEVAGVLMGNGGYFMAVFRLCGRIGTFGGSPTTSPTSTPETILSTHASGSRGRFPWRRLVPLNDGNLFVLVCLFQLSFESYLINRRNLLVFTGQVPLLDAKGSKCFSILLLWVRLL